MAICRREFSNEKISTLGYATHRKHLEIAPGMYTDDTQMTLGVAETLLSGVWTREAFAQNFVTAFKREPRAGYAGGFQKFLESVESGEDFLACIHPGSDKNGAMMRVLPAARLDNEQTVREIARLQASLTHAGPAVLAAEMTAVAGFLLARGCSSRDLGKELSVRYQEIDWTQPWDAYVDGKGLPTAEASIKAVLQNTSMSSALLSAINFTGDVDSVGAIAMGLGSLAQDYTQDLPEHLFSGLENGTYGADYLREMDRVFDLRFPR